MQQPLVGSPPIGAAQPDGTQLAPVAAAPATAPAVGTSPAALTPTSFGAVAGQESGTSVQGGGLVQDGSLPRTAALAGGLAATAYSQQAGVAGTQATVASQPLMDSARAQELAAAPAATAPAAGTPAGPAAWNEGWAKKFKDAGAPAEIIQQLTFTGAMGADEAQLQQMLDQIKGEIDTQLATFAHDHPEAFKKLRSNPEVDRSMIAQIASGVNAGQVPKAQLDQLVDSIGKSQGKMLFDMLVKPMLVYSLIPGWGAIRLGFAPFTDGKDILTGERMFGDKMATTFTVLTALGGGITLWNNARGAMQVAQGHGLVRAGGDAATIAAREGLDNLSLGQKAWSYVPGTKLNQQMAGLSRLDDFKSGIGSLTGMQQELAQNAYNKIVAGDVLLWGDSASKWTKMGYQPNSRGFILGHIMGKKGAMSINTTGSRPQLLVDGRTTGKVAAAHLAAFGTDFADDLAKATPDGIVQPNLKSRLFSAGGNPLDPKVIAGLRETNLAHATQQLLDAGAIAKPSGPAAWLGKMRPGAMQDAMWALDNLNSGSIGTKHGWAGIGKLPKFGLFGALAAAGGFGYWKMTQNAAAKQAEQAAAAQAQAQAGAAGGGAQPSEADQAALQQFAALPPEQQAQIIQQEQATIEQARATPNLTAEQQQQIQFAQAQLELLVQVANGGGAAAPTAASPQAAAPAAPAPAAGAGAPQFTAQGLGLA